MKPYWSRLWKAKREYITSLALLAVVIGYTFISKGAPVGVIAGFIVGFPLMLALVFGPVVYVDAKDIKVAHPKPRFVEPKLWVLSTTIIIGMCVTSAAVFAVLSLVFSYGYVTTQMNADTFVGTLFLVAIMVFGFGLVPAIYMIYIKTHYNKIIEYKTAAWYRVRYPKKKLK